MREPKQMNCATSRKRGQGAKNSTTSVARYPALIFFLKKVLNFFNLIQTEEYAVIILVIERKANSFFPPCELSPHFRVGVFTRTLDHDCLNLPSSIIC